MLKTIKKNCEKCQRTFEGSLKEHKRGGARFCSQSCASQRSRGEKEENCICANDECSKSFYRAESKLKNSRSGLQFCSRDCKEKCQRIVGGLKEIWPDHYGSEDTYAYRIKAFRVHPHKCIDCEYRNTVVLEVHHLDRDNKNSDVSNLVIICPTHHKERRGFRDNLNYNGMNIPFLVENPIIEIGSFGCKPSALPLELIPHGKFMVDLRRIERTSDLQNRRSPK
jgi:hypothetical protein